MSKIADQYRTVFEELDRLSADVAASPSNVDAQRLRSFKASALRAQVKLDPSLQAWPIDKSDRREVARENEDETLPEARVVVSRDPRAMLLSNTLVDSFTALARGERLGPFPALGRIDVWFDVFFATRRTEVREAGAASPAIVFTQARLPLVHHASTNIDIEPGTVWIRGDLVGASIPAAAFVGFKVKGGSLKLDQSATVTTDVVEVAAPLKGILRLDLATDEAKPVAGACDTSNAEVSLPDSVTFTFDAGSSKAEGAAGKAKAWGQEFEFDPSTDTWEFIPQLWMAVLNYDVRPRQFDADPIGDDLVQFDGKSEINSAGLGLPVVVTNDAAILGETAVAASWALQLKGLRARWYDPDPRAHPLGQAWLAISAFGCVIAAEANPPLAPPVTHAYELWSLSGGSRKRLPWRQTYSTPFSLFYRCHVREGEHFLVRGQADVALDRPVTTSGIPVATPAGLGTLLLARFGGTITAMLGALIDSKPLTNQFALRNALLWTGAPSFVFVRGELLNSSPAQIDAGSAQLLLGIYDWAPTLPDPYVANAFIRRPRRGANVVQSLVLAHVEWTAPTEVTISFDGQLGSHLALGERTTSAGDSRPAPKVGSDPHVGPTQVDQDRRTFDREQAAAWAQVRAAETKERADRLKVASEENKRTSAILDRYMTEAAGPASSLVLLDVSTNQDLFGVAFGGQARRDANNTLAGLTTTSDAFPVTGLAVHSELAKMRVIALPQVQWEPVRTLDADQDIMTMGWFPTPLAAANDGGPTQIAAGYQKLMPIIPEDALRGSFEAYKEGIPVAVLTTFPFGLVSAIRLRPDDMPNRKADLYQITRPKFPDEQAVGGIQVTAHAEGGRPDEGGLSPTFQGQLRQLLNGVDLASGADLGISVLGSTGDSAGSVETVFNNDMTTRPRVPVTRIDVSGYGGSNFSDWNNPFAAFAEAAKVQFRYMIGRTALEVIKVNTVWHPWGVRLTRSVTIERRSGGGVIRRDSGWQAFTPGIFDYRYGDITGNILVAPYTFDAGIFRGLFNVRNIRPAPGTPFTHGTAQLVPYYADADVALEGMPGRTAGIGILGYLQTSPNGDPAGADALQALIETQGPIGGPIDAWTDFGGSGLPFRAQRVEVGLAMNGPNPIFVATVRGVPKLPKTGAWSVVMRPVASVPAGGGEAVPVAEKRGVPVIRRYPVRYAAGDDTPYSAPKLDPGGGPLGDHRFADAADLLTPAAPINDYALLQSTPTHAFLFPRPFVSTAGASRLESGHKPAVADIFARSTSKGAFPPPANTIELSASSHHFDVGADGKLRLSPAVSISGHPTPLRISGSAGHGSALVYDTSTIRIELDDERWQAEFSGLRIWSDISGLERISGSELRIVGSTEQRPQIAEIKTLVLEEIENILQYIPLFGQRGTYGPIDLGATNAKHELKLEIAYEYSVPPPKVVQAFPAGSGVKLTISAAASSGLDLATGGAKASATFGVGLEGKVPLLTIGVATVFLIVTGKVTFSLTSVTGAVTAEKLELMAFVGIGVEGKIGPFKAYAFLGVGFVLVYDAIAKQTKYGGLVALEAGIDFKIVDVKIRAELKGLVYKSSGKTKCDYSGSVKVHVDIFLIFSIDASYQVTDTTTF
jgi:hypothetical protein